MSNNYFLKVLLILAADYDFLRNETLYLEHKIKKKLWKSNIISICLRFHVGLSIVLTETEFSHDRVYRSVQPFLVLGEDQ